jgi:hypothetical protein
MRNAALVTVTLALLAATGVWLASRKSPASRPERAISAVAEEQEPPHAASPGAPGDNPSPKAASSGAPVLDRAKRDQLRTLIWHAFGQPSPPEAPAPPRGTPYVMPEKPPWETAPPKDGPPGHIEAQYIQERVRSDFFPLAKKCYGDALEQQPALGGSIVFAFNIVGDPKTGGIVEAVDVLDKSTLRDPDVIDCMRQSFLSVTFPPPENGGEVTVVYPIEFSNDDGGS